MKFFRKNIYSMIIPNILILIILAGCGASFKGESDNVDYKIEKPVNSINEGVPFAKQRAEKWRKSVYLNYINACFVGKENIKTRKGQISYFFYEDSVKKDLDASAEVEIDMNKNSIIRFTSSFGTAKELIGGGGNVLETEKWVVDINEAFDIAIKEIGENKIYKYDNPKVVLRCSQTVWDFAVYPKSDAQSEDWLVMINPETGKVIRFEDKILKQITEAATNEFS